LIGENTIVFEVGSTKTLICRSTIPKEGIYRNTSNWGTEFSGPSAAISGFVQGKQILFVERTAFKLQEKH
jgi:prephenate dehydrogenase